MQPTNNHSTFARRGRAHTAWSATFFGLATIACLLICAPVFAAAPSRALQSVDAVALDGERTLLTLTLSETAPEPKIFTVDQPARLSLDLPDTRLAIAERYKKLNIGVVRAVAGAPESSPSISDEARKAKGASSSR